METCKIIVENGIQRLVMPDGQKVPMVYDIIVQQDSTDNKGQAFATVRLMVELIDSVDKYKSNVVTENCKKILK